MRVILWSLRLSATAHLAGVLVQGALAGLFVTGDVDMLAVHSANANLLSVLVIVQLVTAILLWRPGRGPGKPALASAAIFAAEFVQYLLGDARMVAPHMPLGMLIFGASAGFTVWAWRHRPGVRAGADRRESAEARS